MSQILKKSTNFLSKIVWKIFLLLNFFENAWNISKIDQILEKKSKIFS